MTVARVWIVPLPYTKPPLSLNQRKSWQARHRVTDQVRQDVGWMVRAHNVPPLARVEVQLFYTPPDRRRRDTDNLVATLKVAADAVVDAGVVPDDTPRFMAKPEPVITEPGRPARLWLQLTELPPAPPAIVL